jgi:hypothetical protein
VNARRNIYFAQDGGKLVTLVSYLPHFDITGYAIASTVGICGSLNVGRLVLMPICNYGIHEKPSNEVNYMEGRENIIGPDLTY